MALHPQCKAFLDQLAAMGGKPLHELAPQEARAMALPADWAGPEQSVYHVADRAVPGPRGSILVRAYTPAGGGALPALVYFHGGGFVLGGLDICDRTCRALANLSGCVVVSVDYPLSPEHKFPAAVEDAYAATRYVAEHAGTFGVDLGRIAVGGESAGANLATVVTLMAREKGGPALKFQLLVFPLVDFDDASPSVREFGQGHFITTEFMKYIAGHYLAHLDDSRHRYASPLLADLHGLPPAFVLTAECDPLRDQGEAYARKLEQAGVAVRLKRCEGMFHLSFSLAGIIDGGKVATDDAAQALRAALAPAPVSRT